MTEKPLYKHLGQRSRVFPIARITIGREKEVLEREEFLCRDLIVEHQSEK